MSPKTKGSASAASSASANPMRIFGCVAPHNSSITSDKGLMMTLRNIQTHASSQCRRAIAAAASIMKAVMPICACTYLKLNQAAGILIISRMPASCSVSAVGRSGSNARNSAMLARLSTIAATVMAMAAAATGGNSGSGPSTNSDTGQYRYSPSCDMS